MTPEKQAARSPSRVPARSSLPHGAGKCPSQYIKLVPACIVQTATTTEKPKISTVVATVSR